MTPGDEILCDIGMVDCGPAEFEDDDGTWLCSRCWGELDTETLTQRRAREAGLSVIDGGAA